MALLDSLRRVFRGTSTPGASGATPWQECADPHPMLETLRGTASDRKLRLFGVACCRRIWHRLPQGPNEFNHYAVEVAERFADGRASRQELDEAVPLFTQYALRNELLEGDHAFQTWQVILPDAYEAAAVAAWAAACGSGNAEAQLGERKAQVALLRDIFGNCLESPPSMASAVSEWTSGAVVGLAEAIYEERAFNRLPTLANELKQAGCANSDLLAHCCGGGEHVRGCWVVDLLLGKG